MTSASKEQGCVVTFIRDGKGTRYPLFELTQIKGGRRLRYNGDALPDALIIDVGISREAKNHLELIGSLGAPQKRPAPGGSASLVVDGIVYAFAAIGVFDMLATALQ